MKASGYLQLIITMVVLVMVVFSSCRKDEIFTGQGADLAFSTDTLTFDTVFTQVGSATRSFKIYNKESGDITVDISIENPSNSKFRLNVDGISGNKIENVRIGANDSIYVFADVTVDPDQPVSVSPFIIEENLIIKTGDNVQNILLEAWGQNANYIPSSKGNGLQYRYSCDFGKEFWDDPKPYVIYGVMVLDECELVLPAGTDVYIHGGVVVSKELIYNDGFIIVSSTGKITAEGELGNPVTFQGDRLEESFDDRSGQWVGLLFLAESRGNSFTHTMIKNSIVGIRADSLSEVSLASCEIKNTSASGLIGVNADITASNLLVHDNGQNAVTIAQGGNYKFDYCTFTSFGNQFPALRMDNFRVYPVEDADDIVITHPLHATFTNTIITGNDGDEISLEDFTDGESGFFEYQLDNCLISIDELLEADAFPNFFDHCSSCVRTSFGDVLFVDPDLADFHLDTLSVAEMMAKPISSIFEDLEGNGRDGVEPDVGCYEYQY